MLFYVDGVCGSGKTVTAIQKIAARVKTGETIIYATSTKALLKQTMSGLEELGVEVDLIISDSDSDSYSFQDSVEKRLLAGICALEDNPRVILCITSSLIKVASKITNGLKFPLFIDEGFGVVDSGEYNSKTQSEIQGVMYFLGLSENKPQGYSHHSQYELPDKLKKLEIYSENRSLYEIETNIGQAKFEWVAYLKLPDFLGCFSEVTMLAACFEDTVDYYAAKAFGVKLVALDWGLDKEHYSNGKVTLCWVLSNNEWRTNFVRKLKGCQIERIVEEYSSMGTGLFISVKGIGQGLNLEFDFFDSDGHVIPKPESDSLTVYSHGFNSFLDYNRFINLHCQMPYPYLDKFLKTKFKMTGEQIRKAFYHYLCYQSAMRISLRTSSKNAPIDVDTSFCFGDESTAMYFASKLSSSVSVEYHQLNVGKIIDKKQPRSDKVSANRAEQNNRMADRKKLIALGFEEKVELAEKLLILRDWRRAHVGNRLTDKIIKDLVGASVK